LAVSFISHFVSGFHFSVLVVHVVPRFEINALRTDSNTYIAILIKGASMHGDNSLRGP
jgi:hypothetical protein